MEQKINDLHDIINNSGGADYYCRFSSIPGFPVITNNVRSLAEVAGCYWLLDIIGSYQYSKKLDVSFQVWVLEVDLENSTAVVRGYNDTKLIITQDIPFTDFPLEKLELYLMDGVILLPSEY